MNLVLLFPYCLVNFVNLIYFPLRKIIKYESCLITINHEPNDLFKHDGKFLQIYFNIDIFVHYVWLKMSYMKLKNSDIEKPGYEKINSITKFIKN